MIPQNYPLWINRDCENWPMLVIGWVWPDGGPCRPVAIYEGVNGAAPFTIEDQYQVLGVERPAGWPHP